MLCAWGQKAVVGISKPECE